MVEDQLRLEKIFIREMQETDLPEVVEIERMSFSTPWSERSFFNEIYNPKSISKVAVLKEACSVQRVIGYICANQVADEGHILDLAVHPDFRRKGIARSLVRDIIEDLREDGCRFLYLEVRASNNAAKELYSAFGFTIVGTRKKYYNEPIEDAVIMMLKASTCAQGLAFFCTFFL
jgi:ribosomal-protein-alanine N-acetyltransferase